MGSSANWWSERAAESPIVVAMWTLSQPPRLPLIAPSILSASFTHMADDCRSVLDRAYGGNIPDGGAELLHLDVMDGHFVPNLTMGPDMCVWLRREFPLAFLDAHLMVTDPGRYIDSFADAGANNFTFHAEVTPSRAALEDMVGRIRSRGMTAGLAINPPTPIDRLWALIPPGSPLPQGLAMVLVMSVNPGFSGQAFIPEVLTKTRAIRERFPGLRIQMDGGVGPATVADCRRAGCDVIVAASAIFGKPAAERPAAIATLKRA